MSYMSEYEKLKKKRQSGSEENDSYMSEYRSLQKKREESEEEDIAPYTYRLGDSGTIPASWLNSSALTKPKEDEEDERTWFQSGAFSDGYQFGDVTKTILGTGTDVVQDLVAGAIGIGEGVIDTGAYLVGGAASLLGADEFAKDVRDFIKTDIIDEEAGAHFAVGVSPVGWINALVNGEFDLDGSTTEKNSLLGDKSDSLVQSGGQLAAQIGLQAVGVPWFVTSAVTSFGNEVDNAFNQGASYGEAGLSGVINAGAEILTEKLFGGSGLGEKGLVNVDLLTKGIANKATKALVDYGIDVVGEGVEEVVSQFFGNLGTSLYREENLKDILFSEEAVDGYIESFIGGSVLGGVMNASHAYKSTKSKTDYRTGLTENDQKVFDKVFNDRIEEATKEGKKPNESKIRDELLEDISKGYISTEEIESVLGGDSYKAYKDTVDSENALLEQQKALQDEYNALNKMAWRDMTGEQFDRRDELKAQLAEIKTKVENMQKNSQRSQLKSKLGKEVFAMVKDGRLVESYNEHIRSTQDLDIDVTKYDGVARKTIENAIKSGANNSNRVRDFVELSAKAAKAVNTAVDFGDNKKVNAVLENQLTEQINELSQTPVESRTADQVKELAELKEMLQKVKSGKITVNGVKTKDGILINTQSAKALDFILGHEVTHKLEKTEAYKELQKSLFDYAESLNDLQGRRSIAERLYKNIKGTTADQELTSDLAGEYLFSDSDFIRNFAVEHRNAFQKVLDQIKYWVKIATAGSKEARQLEKAKKLYEDALREVAHTNSTATADSKSGVAYDSATESYTPARFSLSTWNKSDYVSERKKASAEMAKALGITEEKASAYIDSVNSVAKMIADDKTRLDYEASPGRSSFVSNAEYGGSIDFSTICKKRRLFTGTFEAIQNALPNTALTAEEVLEIRKMMKDKGYEVSCGLCYVEGSRANMGQFTKQFIERYKATNPEYVPNMAEMNTASGQEQMRKEHPEVYEAYEYFMNHYGRLNPSDKAIFASQQKPKMYQMATEYKGEILDKFGKRNSSVAEKNKNGGLRLQSFSDFEVIHLIDSMQVIMDMSRVGLAGQAYTKVPDFAWALGDTGLKINLSLIAKDVDANGRLVLDEVEGMKESDAMALRNRYSDNVGTILVAFTDEQLKAAMADERIDYIIPYHRSQWKTDQYESMGLPENTKDYTPWQNESYIEPVYNKNGTKQRPSNYMPNTYWDFTKSGKENAEAYLEMCAMNNRKPKFSHLLVDNQDGSYSLQPDGSTDGYWKTLIDFKMYNNEGIGVPQVPVTPDFNMGEAQRMLNEYTGGHAKFPVAKDVVDEFVSKRKDDFAPEMDDVQYSISVTDTETLDFLNEQVSRGEYDAETNPDGGYYVTYKSMSFWGYDDEGNAILRSPMAEYVDGELSNAYLLPKDKSKLNWYQATETIDEETGLPSGLLVGVREEGKKSKKYVPASENQDLIAEDWSNLYFMLNKKVFDKRTGKWKNSPVPARYNPYEHSSNSMLNDQFKAAWQRDNLVTVKMYVPRSEDNGAYRAQWSKDPTGWSDWKSGDVATKINKQKDLQRRVYLSRYAAPVEIVPDSEVAQAYKGYIEGTDVEIPDNVVSPNLLNELKKAGVPIKESGSVQYSLSEEGEDTAPVDNSRLYGKDFGVKSLDDIAPYLVENEVTAPTDTNVGGKDDEVTDEHPSVTDKRTEVASVIGDKDSFVSKQAMELYNELSNLKKGVRASKKLGYLLDHGYEWRSIKTALLNIKDNPNQVVNPNSAAESVAREMLGREYDAMVEDFTNAQGVTGKIFTKMQNLGKELENNKRLRDQSIEDFDGEIARLQSEYDAKQNKNTKVANDLLRRIERTQRMKANVDADYGKRISDLESRIEKMSKPEYKTAMQRKAKQNEYSNLMAKLVGDTSTWVDKKLGLSYKVNTLRRNLRDVVRDANGNKDIAKADAIYDELQGKYNHNEAELKRESMRIKGVFQKLNLNHAEDTYAHMLGEFRHNPDTKLTEADVKEYYEKHKSKIDTNKVDTAIKESRKVFDDLIVRVNERLREQGMKEIPYRQGYFPHFTNPKQGWLAKLLNWKTVDTEIPTSIAGLTETFNPERSWQGFSKQRKGDTTDYSLEQGLDTYIHGALDWIYHIEDIQKRRALENHIRYVHSEEGVKAKVDKIRNSEELDADEAQRQIDAVYAEANNPLNNFVTNLRAGTNTLANKKSENDRQIESDTNRKIYSVMTNLNNRINANMVVGSFSSALTNFIPITQSWMEVSPVYSLKGMRDTIISTIRDDGMVNKSDFLTNRLMNEENLYQTTWDKVSDKAGFLMEAIDSFTSQTVWRSKYLQNISEGMSETEAIKNADQFAENVIAGRSRGNQPTIFDAKNPITKIFTAFQLEVANQYGYMFKDAPQDSVNKARLVKGYATAFLGAYAYNALYSSLVGRDAAFDPISILEDLFKDLFGDDDEKEKPGDAFLNLVDNVLEEVPFVGGLLGGGRIPISSIMPYSGEYEGLSGFVSDVSEGDWEKITKEMLSPLYYLAMPVGGGQIKKTVEGLGMFSDDHPVAGSYTDSGSLRFPVEDTLGNRIQAALFGQYANENARDYFDNERSPLKEKQIQEYIDVDLPIRDYWEYREGLAEQETLEDKFDYIAGLDLPVAKKNILINNIVDRKEPVDMEGYEDFSGYEEFDFATKNPEKYEFFEANNISFEEYQNADEDGKRFYSDAYEAAKKSPAKVTMAKAVSGSFVEFYRLTKTANSIKGVDLNGDGKTDSGSKKANVKDYIFSLDLDYGQKIILFRSMYDSKSDKATYNMDIVNYLDSRSDISYEEMVAILEELDFKVDGNYVSWD